MSKKTILIVEDDLDLLEQMKLYLESNNYNVITATSEDEGTELINNEKFDLAILDLMITNQDSGFILSYKVKKKDENIPVIIVTAVTKETGLSFDAGSKDNKSWIKADKILNKDIRFEQLKSEVEKLLTEK